MKQFVVIDSLKWYDKGYRIICEIIRNGEG